MPTPEARALVERMKDIIFVRDKARGVAGLAIAPDEATERDGADPTQTGGGDAPTVDEISPADDGSGFPAQDHLQTGGGDAGERARERLEHLILSCQRGEQANRVLIKDVCEEALAALRSSHREGAEAMRDDASRLFTVCSTSEA